MPRKMISMAEVREWDLVAITGKTEDYPVVRDKASNTTQLVRVENFRGTVGSAYFRKGEERYIKIWPADDQSDPHGNYGSNAFGNGKVWFSESDTESIELLERPYYDLL